jgi:hypothetical protein
VVSTQSTTRYGGNLFFFFFFFLSQGFVHLLPIVRAIAVVAQGAVT